MRWKNVFKLGGVYFYVSPQIPLRIPTSWPANYSTLLIVVGTVFITYLQECGNVYKIYKLLQCFQIVIKIFVVNLGLWILHLCVSDFKHELPNSRSSKWDVPQDTFVGEPLFVLAFSFVSLHTMCCLVTIQSMLKTLRFYQFCPRIIILCNWACLLTVPIFCTMVFIV